MAASTSLKRGNATFSSPSGALSVIPLSISSPPPFPLVALTPLPLPGPFTPLSPLTPFKLTLTSPLKLELEEEEEEVTAGPDADAESGFRRSLTLNNVWPRWLGLEGLEGNFNGGSLMGGEDARLTGTESE